MTRLKLFWALSRTPHGLLDMCTPAFGALLWLGGFPPAQVVVIGLITTFAGYTAVYALNDVVDYRVDREKAQRGVLAAGGSDLDGLIVRHPMAQGLLTFREGVVWTVFWSGVALTGALILNPACVAIFAGGCLLEAVYCWLWRVSPYRTAVSGAVKSTGAMAAVFAVDPQPSPVFLSALFLMLFFWEVGGQNIPNDLTDVDEDRSLRAKTIAVRWGVGRAVWLSLCTLCASVLLSVAAFKLSPLSHSAYAGLLAALAGIALLVWPGVQLTIRKDRAAAMALFNRASLYPPILAGIVLAALIL
jgi:4-hydroxybenzoate polyprenyltransferase